MEDEPRLTPAEKRGRDLHGLVCGKCHGGLNQATIVDRKILALPPDNNFVNVGVAMEMHLALIGATEHESFTKDVGFPKYRYRFYTDGSRTEVDTDLPRLFGGDDSGDDHISGLADLPQFFSTDPGRSAITGSAKDYEAFDIPTLRGIAKTSPYFHNNTVTTLEEVVELYSDHFLSRFPALTQPGEKELDPDGDIGPEETFTAGQKKDLVAFLKRL
jgi:cytochrome c peroxidase